MSDGGLVSVLVSRDVLVEVGQATGRSLGDVAELVPRHHVGLQVVRQRALREERGGEVTEPVGYQWNQSRSVK